MRKFKVIKDSISYDEVILVVNPIKYNNSFPVNSKIYH
ncbi:hypothetical protein EHF_0417 [Ehrlichia japonica]|uniref:Uncharacterized protein n=1 Tax=Ehrlichia japonica TaxID=391036 RepID=X5GKR1_9RICK|nr:hypothetical protein EHF_0417 [Ehrlichia japonica]